MLKDQLLRAMAETENVRRRTEREKADASKYAVTNFARAILSVADNLNRALESVAQEARDANEDLNNLFVGVEMTENELETVFEQFGIKTIDALGKKFDHNYIAIRPFDKTESFWPWFFYVLRYFTSANCFTIYKYRQCSFFYSFLRTSSTDFAFYYL